MILYILFHFIWYEYKILFKSITEVINHNGRVSTSDTRLVILKGKCCGVGNLCAISHEVTENIWAREKWLQRFRFFMHQYKEWKQEKNAANKGTRTVMQKMRNLLKT